MECIWIEAPAVSIVICISVRAEPALAVLAAAAANNEADGVVEAPPVEGAEAAGPQAVHRPSARAAISRMRLTCLTIGTAAGK